MATYTTALISMIFTGLFISLVNTEVHHLELQQGRPNVPDFHVSHDKKPLSSSIVLSSTSSKKTNFHFIHLVNPPVEQSPSNQELQVEYSCQAGDVMGLDVVASSQIKSDVRIFRQHWDCAEGVGHVQTMLVRLRLQDSLLYRPDYLNPHALIVTQLRFAVWVLPQTLFNPQRKRAYELSLANAVYLVAVPMPYERPRKDHEMLVCLRWDAEIMMRYREEDVLRCDYESDVVQLLKYPVALAGMQLGVTRELQEFNSKYLLALKARNLEKPRFTISTLIYIIEYCKTQLCSLFHRKTKSSNKYVTPLLFMNNKGEMHIQVHQSNGQSSSMLSHYQLPKHQWIRLVFSMDNKKWKLHMSHGKKFSTRVTTGASFVQPVLFNDTDGYFHLGGSQSVASFRGYMAETKLWRTKALEHHQIPLPTWSDDMYRVGLEDSHQKCTGFVDKMERVYNAYLEQGRRVKATKTTSYTFESVLGLKPPSYFPPGLYCKLWGRRPPHHQQLVWKALRRVAVKGRKYEAKLAVIGSHLYDAAVDRLVEGMSVIPKIIPILKQASCYDNSPAAYMLSTLYSGGMGISQDKHKGIKYQLIAAQGDYPPALTAIGDKHQFGQEDVPFDLDYAYNYFKNAADKAVKDKETHDANGVYTEMVRLTDTDALQHQTGEKGDYFLWMKYQAKQGLADAQINLARMLFWGQHGVARDLPLAIQYFNEYLANNPADPLANYDMAVILLRGQGTTKNTTRALEHLNRSAELGHAPAYTALGWYALNHQKNISAAVKYFEKADALGHRDAAHNLGFLYRVGRYPNKSIDEVTAFKYYLKAGRAGHIDSGVMVAEMYNQGNIAMPRSSADAVSWARYIAEQNSGMGHLLRTGLDSYLQGSWSESLIYYMMAAEAGVEVAQFNLAFLCEEDHENLAASYVHADCVWKYYNKSSNSNQPPVLAQIKMGDYHWYGYQGHLDTDKAVDYYGKAALQKDPQALFNLGYLAEKHVGIKSDLLKSLGVDPAVINSTDDRGVAMELYRMCRDHTNKEAYVPCGLAVLRLQWQDLWIHHTLLMKVLSAILFGLLTSLSFATFLTHIRGYRASEETV